MKEIEKQKMSEHRYYPLMVAAAYGVVSITITLFNKVRALPSRFSGSGIRSTSPLRSDPLGE